MTIMEAPRPAPAAAQRPGMGAIPYDGGTSFRVWAPNANEVYVSGTFNDWSPDMHALVPEGNGYWSTDVEGAKPGDRYKFRLINGDQELWRMDPYAREVTSSVGEAVIFDPSFDWDEDDYRTPSWNEMIIYEMHIGTFNTSPDKLPGDFDAAIEKLPYLRDLGVNVVQVMPPMEFPGGISWGYNTAHIFAVESDYGGPLAFKRFVKAAHAHGIAVILDVAYNHLGPSDLGVWQFDGWSENGMGGIYFYNDERASTPWGDTRPDYGREEVRQYLRDNALMWLNEFHVDGLRFDATAYIRNWKGDDSPDGDLPEGWQLLQWINGEIRANQPWKVTIAEDLRGLDSITAPVEGGGAGFNAQWDAGFVHPVREALIPPDDARRNLEAVAEAILRRYNDDAFTRVIYTESHDEVANGKARLPEEIWPDNAGSWVAKKRSTLGGALALTAPGIPMLFQGQEFLSDAWFEDQTPLDWTRLETFGGIHRLYSDLMVLRRNAHNTTRGLTGQHVELLHCNPETKVLAYHRWADGGPQDSTIVVANLSSEPWIDYWIGLPAEGLWKVRFNSDTNLYDAEFSNHFSYDVTGVAEEQDGQPCRGMVSVGPYSVIILSQDAA